MARHDILVLVKCLLVLSAGSIRLADEHRISQSSKRPYWRFWGLSVAG